MGDSVKQTEGTIITVLQLIEQCFYLACINTNTLANMMLSPSNPVCTRYIGTAF